MTLSGHVALVTAAAGAGIGRATARCESSVAALTKLIATEYAGAGVRSNAVVPGVVWDERGSMLRLLPQEYWDENMKGVPAGRYGRPDEVAGVVSLLCSDDASFVHGTTIEASGGMHYWTNPLPDWTTS